MYSLSFAGFFGAQLLSGFMADTFGRKRLILLSMSAISIFGLISSLVPHRFKTILS